MRRIALLVALLVFVPLAAPAAPVALRLTYVTYAAGFTTLKLTATLDSTAEGYRLTVDYRTVGTVGFLSPGHAEATAEGSWKGTGAAPVSFESEGKWGGKAFDVQMAYEGGSPEILVLEPKAGKKREIVPDALRAGTIDTVSAIALLIGRMANGEGCGMAVKVFDGRRLIALSARPAGSETLGVTMRSFFHGPAKRCDVAGKTLAGFLRAAGPAERAHVTKGAVWFAHPVSGLPLLPVRITFSTRWVGAVTMYLTNVEAAPPAEGLRRVALSPASRVSQEDQARH